MAVDLTGIVRNLLFRFAFECDPEQYSCIAVCALTRMQIPAGWAWHAPRPYREELTTRKIIPCERYIFSIKGGRPRLASQDCKDPHPLLKARRMGTAALKVHKRRGVQTLDHNPGTDGTLTIQFYSARCTALDSIFP